MRHDLQISTDPASSSGPAGAPRSGRRGPARAWAGALVVAAITLGLTACDLSTIVRVNGDYAGSDPTLGAESGDISDDGSIVVFTSKRSYDPGDTNGFADVFVHDRNQELISRITSTPQGGAANGGSTEARISGNGRYVIWTSDASNLVPGDTNNTSDVFLFDFWFGGTQRISVSSAGVQESGPSMDAAASTDGRYVVFQSQSVLAANDSGGTNDVYVRDTVLDTTTLASVDEDGVRLPGANFTPEISADGRVIVFASSGAAVEDDKNGLFDIYRVERGRPPVRVSSPRGGGDTDNHSERPVVNADGSVIAFDSLATNLDPADTDVYRDVFVWRAGVVYLVSQADDVIGSNPTAGASLDLTGNLVGFSVGTANTPETAIVHDRGTGTNHVVSSSVLAESGNSFDQLLALRGDGRGALVRAFSTNLIPDDTNGAPDLFVKSYPFPKVTAVGPTTLAPGTTTLVTIDGRGFAGPMTVTADANPGGDLTFGPVSVISSTRIRVQVTVPAGSAAKVHDLEVSNIGTFPDDAAGASTTCYDCLTVG